MSEEKPVENVKSGTEDNSPEPKSLGAKAKSDNHFADLDFSKLEISLEEMFRNGVHFGHSKSRKNPKMDEYIFGIKNGISILDLQKTSNKLKTAMDYIRETVSGGGEILFVGTKKQAKNLVESAAKRCAMPYVTERWLGGTFTNFSVISARTRYLREGEEKMKKGEYAKYTKLEQTKIAEKLKKLERIMGGIKDMRNLPAAIFAASTIEDNLAIKEAKMKDIPVIALVDSNSNPKGIDYIIPANEDAVSSLRLMLSYVCKAVLEGKSKIPACNASRSDAGRQIDANKNANDRELKHE